jgi:hypothetical protein
VSGQDQDEQFERHVGAALEDSTSALDARTLSRLTRARQAALARGSWSRSTSSFQSASVIIRPCCW